MGKEEPPPGTAGLALAGMVHSAPAAAAVGHSRFHLPAPDPGPPPKAHRAQAALWNLSFIYSPIEVLQYVVSSP
jgi:hypothetical protein